MCCEWPATAPPLELSSVSPGHPLQTMAFFLPRCNDTVLFWVPPPPYTCPFCLQGPVGHLGTASLCHPCFKSMGSWKSVPNRAALWDNYHHGDCLVLSVYCSSIGFLPSSVCREWSLVHLFGGVSQGRASTRNEQANVPRRNEAILALPVATWVTLGKPLSFMWNHTMKSTCYED